MLLSKYARLFCTQAHEVSFRIIQILSSPLKAPLFHPATSDEDIREKAAPPMFCPANQSLAISPALVPMDEDDGFVLDSSLFDIYPSTPTLTDAEANSVQTSHSRSNDAIPTEFCAHFVGSHRQPNFEQHSTYKDSLLEQTDLEECDPYAEFEAWLTSGAVDIMEQ